MRDRRVFNRVREGLRSQRGGRCPPEAGADGELEASESGKSSLGHCDRKEGEGGPQLCGGRSEPVLGRGGHSRDRIRSAAERPAAD